MKVLFLFFTAPRQGLEGGGVKFDIYGRRLWMISIDPIKMWQIVGM